MHQPGTPQLGALTCPVADSPAARCPFGGGPTRPRNASVFRDLASTLGISAIRRWPVLRRAPKHYDEADFLVCVRM
eukprot:8580965-Alexandrium_andersonii.AAC.1